ncbi:MAG: MFS transporter [Chloroflexota bacterium]
MSVQESVGTARIWRLGRGHQLLFFLACGFPINFLSMVGFLIPLRAHELGAPLELVGVIVGAGAVLGMVLAVPAGALADRMGPRQAFVIGTLLNGLAALGFWLAESYWLILAFQFARGLPHSLSWVASQSYLSTIGDPAERTALAGKFSFASGLGGLISPLVIGTVATFMGFQNSFAVVVLYCLLTVLMGLALPDVRSPRGQASTSSGGYAEAATLLRQRGPQVAVLLTFVRLWVGTGWNAFFPIYLAERGFSPAVIGSVVSGSGLVSSVTGLSAHRLARRTSNQVATAAALALGAFGTAISPHVAFIPLVYAPALFQGVGAGFSMPLVLAMLSQEVPASQRGIAMGLRTGANQAGNLVAPVVTGVLIGAFGLPLGFLGSAVLCWSVLGFALWLHAGGPAESRPDSAKVIQSAEKHGSA